MQGDFGFGWLDRWARRAALRHTMSAYRAQTGATPGRSAGSVVLVVSSLLLYSLILAVLAVGLWLCRLSFPGPGLLPGLLLVAIAIELRPRLGRVPKFASPVPASSAPELHRLVGQVAAALGGPVPDVYVEEEWFNATAERIGLRRRPVLVIGLPLWNALSAQQRVALLAHEMGHFVNGDPRRGLLVQPALTTLGRLHTLLTPAGRMGWLDRALVAALAGALRAVILPPRLLLAILALRDGQRAEYRADRVAATVAGRSAAMELFDLLLLIDSVRMLIKRDARAGRPVVEWPETVAKMLAEARPGIEARREAELAELSLFATHPPNGLRARMVAAQGGESAAVVANGAQNDRIDAELAAPGARSARTLKSL